MKRNERVKDFWVRIESATSTVTGSFIELEPCFPNGVKEPILVFDCGLFSGKYEKYNQGFPCDVSKVDRVYITHAHNDHMGRISEMYNKGYIGKVYSSEYTTEVIKSTAIKNYFSMKRRFEEALYEEKDAIALINNAEAIELNKNIKISEHVEIEAFENAHMKGAVMYMVTYKYDGHKIKILITSDYKRESVIGKSYFPQKERYGENVTIVTESTHGIQERPNARFSRDVEKAIAEKKSILVAAIGTDKYKSVMYELKQMQEEERLDKNIPIYFEIKKRFDISKVDLNILPANLNFVNNTNSRKEALYDSRQRIIIVTHTGAMNYYIPNVIEKVNWTIIFLMFKYKGSIADRLMIEKGSAVTFAGKECRRMADVRHSEEFSEHDYFTETEDLIQGFKKVNCVFLGHGEDKDKRDIRKNLMRKIPGLNVQILERGKAFKIFEDGIRHAK